MRASTVRNRRLALGAGVALLAAVVIAAATGTLSGSGKHPTTASTVPSPVSVASGTPVTETPCGISTHRPRPSVVVLTLKGQGHLVGAAPGPATPPKGACTAASFTDSRGSGTSLIVAYPDSAAANAAAQRAHIPALTFAAGIYVATLTPSLGTEAADIHAALALFAVKQEAWTGSPPTTAQSVPSTVSPTTTR